MVRFDDLSLGTILVLESRYKEVLGLLGTHFRGVYLWDTLGMIGLNNKGIGPSNGQVMDSVDVIGVIDGCLRVQSIIQKLIIIIIKDGSPGDVTDLSVHRGIVELHLKSREVIIVFILMSFEYTSHYVLFLLSRLEDERTTHIFHSAVQGLSVLELIVNSDLPLKFKGSAHYGKVRIVTLDDTDGRDRELKEAHGEALLHCPIVLVRPVALLAFCFITREA